MSRSKQLTTTAPGCDTNEPGRTQRLQRYVSETRSPAMRRARPALSANGTVEGSALVPEQADPFMPAVPEAELDIILLTHKARVIPQLARFQSLLRALCTLRHAISRAAMLDDRIELQVEDWRLVLGNAGPLHMLCPGFCRPDICNATRQGARLAYFIHNHALALRLRVAATAPREVLADICQVVMQLQSPSAVILTETGLILSKQEFEIAFDAGLGSLRPGPALPELPSRYERPRGLAASPTPSAFAGKTSAQGSSELRLAEGLAARICIERDSAALAAVFRKPIPTQPSAMTDEQQEAPLCDAVILRWNRSAAGVIAPLLVATLVLATEIPIYPGPLMADVSTGAL